MAAPINPTAVRTTDVVIDKVIGHLGNDGVSMGDDFVARLDQALGVPVEITPQSPATTAVTVGPSIYVLPDGTRVGVMSDGYLPMLAQGTIDFQAGTISTGGNPTFTVPSIASGQYVRALVQFKIDEGNLDVTFGTVAGSLTSAGIPAILDDYTPVYIVELQAIGTNAFDVVAKSALVKVAGSFKAAKGPSREVQDVAGSAQTVFTLAQVTIPKNRNRLLVLQNGILLSGDDYTVNSDTQVTMTAAVPVNGRVTFLVI